MPYKDTYATTSGQLREPTKTTGVMMKKGYHVYIIEYIRID